MSLQRLEPRYGVFRPAERAMSAGVWPDYGERRAMSGRVVNLQAAGAAYWRTLLMALWSLLNPTHPQ